MRQFSDHPIDRAEDDTLGRTPIARSFARQVLELDTREGVVVGVLGAWGFGKTSFINLARIEFEAAGLQVLDFNPWMFSSAEQLVDRFFIELAAQLRVRVSSLAEIAEQIEDYGEALSGLAWIPVAGPWLARGRLLARISGGLLKSRKEGIGARRDKLRNELAKLRQPIVVVVDDIDRLSSDEIRDVFKLVRLTASFPQIIYIVAFDRRQVEAALSDTGITGRDYLEKILQLAVDLPAIPPRVLRSAVLTAIDDALSGIENPGPFDNKVWTDAFLEIVSPLVRNVRDVKRYACATRTTVMALGGQVALSDVLALEAVRIFMPDVFRLLPESIDGLTNNQSYSSGGDHEPPRLKKSVQSLLNAADGHQEIVRCLINRLFPGANRHIGEMAYGPEWRATWLRGRRVAHEDVLRFYLEGAAGEGYSAFTDAEKAFRLMDDPEALDDFLRSLDSNRLDDVVGSLEVFEDEYSVKHVVPGIITLLNLLPDLPDHPRGMFELGSDTIVRRVVYRLLRSLDSPEATVSAVSEILPHVESLSSKLGLITIVGYKEGVGHKLVSESVASLLEANWRAEVRSASPTELEGEEELFRVLWTAKTEAQPDEPAFDIPEQPSVTVPILRTARTVVISQSLDSSAVERSPRLHWDGLVELFGTEEELRRNIEQLEGQVRDDDVELLELAKKYLSGWRPQDLGEDMA